MTRSELRARVRTIINRDTDAISNADLDININWAQHWIAKQHTFEEMERVYEGALTVDERLYNTPTNMKDFISIRIMDDSQSRKLIYISRRRFDDAYPDPTVRASAHPLYYVDYGNNFELLPEPNSAYTIRIRTSQYPTDLDDDSSSSTLKDKDQLIIAKAVEHTFRAIRELEDAEYWSQHSDRLLRDSIRGDRSREDWDRVPVGFGIEGRTLHHTNPFSSFFNR